MLLLSKYCVGKDISILAISDINITSCSSFYVLYPALTTAVCYETHTISIWLEKNKPLQFRIYRKYYRQQNKAIKCTTYPNGILYQITDVNNAVYDFYHTTQDNLIIYK